MTDSRREQIDSGDLRRGILEAAEEPCLILRNGLLEEVNRERVKCHNLKDKKEEVEDVSLE